MKLWRRKEKKWKPGFVSEHLYARRDPEYVFPSKKDKKIYGRVKKAVEDFEGERRRCLLGTVIYTSNGSGLMKLRVTSEVLARLAEQKCSFSAYRVGENKYRVDQINHRDRYVILKDWDDHDLDDDYDKEKKWKPGFVSEHLYARRDPEYVFPSKKDKKIYGRVKKAVEDFEGERRRCLLGTVIYTSNGSGLMKLRVTSEVLARLAEQKCSFSAYRVGENKYLVDQINHKDRYVILKDWDDNDLDDNYDYDLDDNYDYDLDDNYDYDFDDDYDHDLDD